MRRPDRVWLRQFRDAKVVLEMRGQESMNGWIRSFAESWLYGPHYVFFREEGAQFDNVLLRISAIEAVKHLHYRYRRKTATVCTGEE